MAPTNTKAPGYEFRVKPEMIWFVVVTVTVTVMLQLTTFDPDGITDWNAWGVGLAAAAVRAFAGAVIAVLTSPSGQIRKRLDRLRGKDAGNA